MASFDFITDEDFRTSLEKDFEEMNLCIQFGAYKAAVVIAGSVVETVLIDYVIAENIAPRDEALKFDFGRVLSLCKDQGIISNKTLDLSSAIKGYRNLIHPGRLIRLNENVDKDGAEVARALVSIVLKEVEKRKRENYGYTAEQIISKINNDSNSAAILPFLIKKTNPVELERLIFKLLPQAYMDEYLAEDSSFPSEYGPEREYIKPTLVQCFRTIHTTLDNTTKEKVSKWFVKLLSEESDQVISSYGMAFLRGSDLRYMSPDDADLVLHHLLGRMKNNMNALIIETLSDIGPFIKEENVNDFIDPIVKFGCSKVPPSSVSKKLGDFLDNLALDINSNISAAIYNRLEKWKSLYQRNEQTTSVEKIEEIMASIIPF